MLRAMTIDYLHLEQQLAAHVGAPRRPVAVAFRPTPPAGVEKFSGSQPSGCSFWRLAGAGRVFYTVPNDHANCAIGAHTHAIKPADNNSRVTIYFLIMHAPEVILPITIKNPVAVMLLRQPGCLL